MTRTLAIGPYNDAEKQGLATAFDPVFLDHPDAIAGLDAQHRDLVTTVAYKGHSAFGAAEMGHLPQLGLVANYGVGYDSIDVATATARGVKVTNTPDVLNDDVADLAVAMLIMQAREMERASRWARSGKWAERGEYRLTRKVSGGRVGIVGLGRIGRDIAERLAAFKMEVHYWSRTEKDTPGWTYHPDPVALAGRVDYLVVALVGGPETEAFVSRDVIQAWGPHGILVKISRGSTVEEAALLEALETGRIAGAALDVF